MLLNLVSWIDVYMKTIRFGLKYDNSNLYMFVAVAREHKSETRLTQTLMMYMRIREKTLRLG